MPSLVVHVGEGTDNWLIQMAIPVPLHLEKKGRLIEKLLNQRFFLNSSRGKGFGGVWLLRWFGATFVIDAGD